jgi:hypothetical protein
MTINKYVEAERRTRLAPPNNTAVCLCEQGNIFNRKFTLDRRQAAAIRRIRQMRPAILGYQRESGGIAFAQ